MEKYFKDGISKCLYAFNYDDEDGNKVDVLSTCDENGVNYNTIFENGILAGRSIMVEIKDGYNFHNLYEPSIIRYDEDGEIWSREYYVLGEYITNNKKEFFEMKEKCMNLSILKSINKIRSISKLEKYKVFLEYYLCYDTDPHDEETINKYNEALDKLESRLIILKLEQA